MTLGAGLLAGCTHAASEVPTARDGWLHYAQGRTRGTYPCRSEPVSVDGDRNNIRLTGACERVRIAGSHNDITVEVMPGGTIEITGGHNDVTWRQSAPGPKPELKDTGVSNSFHHEET
jgi:hypothetical protein